MTNQKSEHYIITDLAWRLFLGLICIGFSSGKKSPHIIMIVADDLVRL